MTKRKTRRRFTWARGQKYLKGFLVGLLRYTLLICLAYLILAPILSNIVTAITHPADLGLSSSIWIPNRFSLQNMHVTSLILNYWKTLPSSLLYTLIIMLLQLVCTLLAGYSFARLKFTGQNILFFCVIVTIIVPSQIIMLPQYLYFKDFKLLGIIPLYNQGKGMNLLNNPAVIYVLSALGMGLKSGLYIYIFRQTFRGLPKELEQAAYVDGAGFIRTFTSIVLPCAGPGLITVGTLSFVWNWNDVSFLSWFDPANTKSLMFMYIKRTASMKEALDSISSKVPGTYTFLSNNLLYQNAISKTCALFVLIPLIILYLIVQRRFVQGVERRDDVLHSFHGEGFTLIDLLLRGIVNAAVCGRVLFDPSIPQSRIHDLGQEHPHVMKILGGQVFLFAKEILNDLCADLVDGRLPPCWIEVCVEDADITFQCRGLQLPLFIGLQPFSGVFSK